MQFVDPSPPSSPSAKVQLDALRKGLGRTMQWALAGKLDDEPLLEACRRDWRHDQQVEFPRGAWLWQLVQAVHAVARFREPLLQELRALSDRRSVFQLCELAYFYAAMGDEDFRKILYHIVEHNDASDASRQGEEEILRLDGKDAVLFIARVRGQRLERRAWDWDDGSFVHDAVELLGADQVSTLLQSSDDPFVARFCASWIAEQKTRSERRLEHNGRESMEVASAEAIIAEAESERPANWRFRHWGMHASEDELLTVLAALWSAKQPSAIESYLRVFSNRALPSFDARMIGFCSHPDERVRRFAFHALEMNSHPSVREFAIANIRRHGLRDARFVQLLVRNYAAGDEQLLMDALEMPADENQCHWLLMDLLRVLESNAQSDPSQLGLVVYAYTPCENCRFSAAQLLHERGAVPEWMPSECQFDSSEQSRELFRAEANRS